MRCFVSRLVGPPRPEVNEEDAPEDDEGRVGDKHPGEAVLEGRLDGSPIVPKNEDLDHHPEGKEDREAGDGT